MMILVTKRQIDARLKTRPASYMQDLEPVIVERRSNGDMVFDSEHPAWLAAKAKYAATPQPKPGRQSDSCPFRTCASCAEAAMCRIDGQQCEFGPGTFVKCTKQKPPAAAAIPCSTCQRRATCPVGNLSPCARKRAWAGDKRYPIPPDCPAKPLAV